MAVAFKVEIAFGHTFGESHTVSGKLYPGPADVGWTDVSDYVSDIDLSRGRNNEFDEIEAGTLSLTLDNADGRFTPERSTSPYYPNVVPKVPVRVTASVDAWVTTVPVFYGHAEKWPVDLSGISQVSLSATDLFGFLGGTDLKEPIVNRFLNSAATKYLPLTPAYRLSCLKTRVDGVIKTTPGSAGVVSWETTDRYTFGGDGVGAGLAFNTSLSVAGAVVETSFDLDMTTAGYTVMFAWFPDTRADATNAPGQTLLRVLDSTESAPRGVRAIGLAGGPGYDFTVIGQTTGGGAAYATSAKPVFVAYSLAKKTALWSETVSVCGPSTGGTWIDVATFTAPASGTGKKTIKVALGGALEGGKGNEMASGSFAHLATFVGSSGTIVDGYASTASTVNELAALNDVVTWAGLSTGLIEADAARSTRSPLDWSGSKPALESVRAIGADSGGVIYPAASGRLRYLNRHARVVSGAPTVQFTAAANALPEPELQLFVDDSHIINDVTLRHLPLGGGEGTVTRFSDAASLAKYGPAVVDAETSVTDKLEAADAAAWKVALAASPVVRVEAITFNLSAFPNPSLLLGVDVGTRVRVEFPDAAPWSSKDFWVEGVALSTNAVGAVAEANITFKLSPSNIDDGWILEDAVTGLIDSTARLVY